MGIELEGLGWGTASSAVCSLQRLALPLSNSYGQKDVVRLCLTPTHPTRPGGHYSLREHEGLGGGVRLPHGPQLAHEHPQLALARHAAGGRARQRLRLRLGRRRRRRLLLRLLLLRGHALAQEGQRDGGAAGGAVVVRRGVDPAGWQRGRGTV